MLCLKQIFLQNICCRKKIEDIENKVVQITEEKYKQLTEGFSNQTDEQFNQLLLYIFTGIFYLFMLDLMYQLVKSTN